MVDAVDQEMHALGEGTFALVVEYGAVKPILGQRPERETAEEEPGAQQPADSGVNPTRGDQREDAGHV